MAGLLRPDLETERIKEGMHHDGRDYREPTVEDWDLLWENFVAATDDLQLDSSRPSRKQEDCWLEDLEAEQNTFTFTAVEPAYGLGHISRQQLEASQARQ
ncbi:MAG: hypothetical protein GY696_23480 [Gammaproteobacteria bacterium]|nr:hypothetical protein [Gammaproteobacteria bacterium]